MPLTEAACRRAQRTGRKGPTYNRESEVIGIGACPLPARE
jgi:hypothetical protein